MRRLMQRAGAPAQRLYRHAQVLFKADWVGDMPAVHAEALLALVEAVRLDHLWQAQIGRGIGAVFAIEIAKAPGAAEIVLGARAADRGEVAVAIHIEFDFALAPPAAIVAAPSHVGPDIVAHALDAIDDRIIFFVGQGVAAPPLRVQVADIVRHIGQRVIELVIKRSRFFVQQVLNRDAGALAERHFPIAVEGALRIDRYRQRVDRAIFGPAVAEEIAKGRFDGWRLFIVPIEAQDQRAPELRKCRDPDVLNRAGSINLGERCDAVRRQMDAGRHLPALAQVLRRRPGDAIGGHAARPFFALEVLRADGARLGVGQARDIAHVQMQTVEVAH